MAKKWASQAKAGFELRLDPCHLPQNVAFITVKEKKPMLCTLNERGVSLRLNTSDDSLTLNHIIPAHLFKGIAARAVKTQSGHMAISLELWHEESENCIPLLVSRDLDDVLLDWRIWADTYDLPMLLINDDETLTKVTESSPLKHFLKAAKGENFKKSFMLRCRGHSLGLRLVIANQVMLG